MKNHAETEAWKINPFTSQLGRRIVLILILVSGSITLMATLTQLFYEYKQQFNTVELRHKEIQDIHTRLMARSLWDFDLVLLKQRMNSLVTLPDIDYLSVQSGDYQFEAGMKVTGNKLTHSYPLTFDDPYTGEHNTLGGLYVESDTSSIYRGLINKFFTTLAINSTKTLFVCYIILVIFHKSINQRIIAIMSYLRSYSPQLKREPLEIKKPD